jgi:hypothetical protein
MFVIQYTKSQKSHKLQDSSTMLDSYLTLGSQLKGQFTCKEASSHYKILSFDGH